MKMMVSSGLPLFLVTLLHAIIPQSLAQWRAVTRVNETVYSTLPQNVTVAAADPAIFQCGVSPVPPRFNFTIHSSHGEHTISCPGGKVVLPVEALTGSCKQRDGEEIAEWSFSGTSYSDSDTRVECEVPGLDAAWATLTVFKYITSYITLIGCAIGGFFGILLVAGLAYIMIQRSPTLQECFKGAEPDEDMDTIVSKD